ncbi:hypothetical protein, partial [Sphingopyxis sp. NFH-91]|uniref:hypothetical protein n=1 Tax=Sphingopyxis sp. NFH-91 TaxID=2744457 RepID=UPI001F43667F
QDAAIHITQTRHEDSSICSKILSKNAEISTGIGQFGEKLRIVRATLCGEGEEVGIKVAATFEPPHHRQ